MGIFLGIVAVLAVLYFMGKSAAQKQPNHPMAPKPRPITAYNTPVKFEYYRTQNHKGTTYVVIMGDETVMGYASDGNMIASNTKRDPDARTIVSMTRQQGQKITKDEFDRNMPYDREFREAYQTNFDLWKAQAIMNS